MSESEFSMTDLEMTADGYSNESDYISPITNLPLTYEELTRGF